ncbi:PD-(D/E)XK nuclease family protein [Candidatus Calescamantes bacterium]|nr:PD-(D/E)XK nuclease family protein [Candidatus Calescamantes bacterium]
MQDHISVTQLKMYLRCPLQYKFRYVDNLIIPPPSAITLGKTIHQTLEENFSQKVKTQEDLPLGYLTDYFSDLWEIESKETRFEEGEKPGKIKDEGINLVSVYHKTHSPKILPISVEEEFELEFENSPLKLKGYIDLIDKNKIIIDHKIKSRSMTQQDAEQDLQLTAYYLAYKVKKQKPPKGLRFDVIVRTKTPKIQQISISKTDEDTTRFLKILTQVTRAIHAGIFYPNESFYCNVCGYRELCKKW